MKKILVYSLILWTLLSVWCNKKNDNTLIESSSIDKEICTNNNWKLEILWGAEDNATVCVFKDSTFCFIEDLQNWTCKKWDTKYYKEEDLDNKLSECDALWKDIVCWNDWITYFNRCYLELWWEKENKSAKIISWQCVFE